MKTITIKESDYSLKDGFAYAVFFDGELEFTIQACLMERSECKDDQRRHSMIKSDKEIYKKVINSNDTGMDWGISGEANRNGFEKYGKETCWKLFKREMKKQHQIKFI